MNYQYTNDPVNEDTEARIHEFPEVNDTDVVYLGFDCETSGLLPKPWEDTPEPGLMEIGLVGFNKDFDPVRGFSSPVITPEAIHHRAVGLAPAAYKMHTTRRGNDPSLLDVIDTIDPNTHHAGVIEQLAIEFIDDNGYRGLPMLGSSITFDRDMLYLQMPKLLDAFHFRSVDATSFSLVVTNTLREGEALRNGAVSDHRVISDVLDSASLIRRSLDVIQGN